MDMELDQGQDQGQNLDVEAQAREMGWRPKEEFKGDPSKWVDAATFLERGEHVLPIVREMNKRLRSELSATNEKLNEVTAALNESRESMAALERYHQEDVRRKVEQARKEIKAKLAAAKRDGNIEDEVEFTDALLKLGSEVPENELEDLAKTRRRQPTPDYTKHPEWIAWKSDNPWFGTDPARTAIAYDVSSRLRLAGDTSTGREFLDKMTAGVNKEVARLAGGSSKSSKVEGSRGGAGNGSGRGRTYNDLPAEAKAACDSYARELVGPNRRYKTVAEWQAAYAEQYFQEV